MTAMEWNDLAAQSLPTLSSSRTPGGSSRQGSGSNAVAEVSLASAAKIVGGPSPLLMFAGSNMNSGSSAPPLGSSLFPRQDPLSITNANAAPTTAATTTNSAGQRQQLSQPSSVFESVPDMLARHEQGILESILQRNVSEVTKRLNAAVDDQIQRGFEKQREVWTNELVGARWLGGSSMPTAANNNNNNSNDSSSNGNALSSPAVAAGGLKALGWSDGNGLGSSNNVEQQRFTPYRRQGRSTSGNPAALLPDLSLVESHLEIVQQNLKRPSDMANRFLKSIPSSSSSSSLLHTAYRSAWQLVSQLVAVRERRPSSSSGSPPVDLAQAALVHLCRQFYTMVENFVRGASLAGQEFAPSNFRSDVARQCAAFCQLKVGDSGDSSWPLLYFCMRCGDAVAAAEVFQQASSSRAGSASASATGGEADRSIQNILSAVAQVQQNASCFWEAGTPKISDTDRRVVMSLLERTSTREQGDIYQIGFYSLLAGKALTESLTNSVEDYLAGEIWKALLHPSSNNPVDELVQLGKSIQQYGPDHFDVPDSGGWSFAFPLLVTQQYRKALSYLVHAGHGKGLLQATHVGMVLFMAGIPVCDLDRGESEDRTNRNNKNRLEMSESSQVVASLMTDYAAQLLVPSMPGAPASLEYLLRIPDKVRAHREVAALIAKTGAVELAGTLDIAGIRQGGALMNKHFSKDEISAILADAANNLMNQAQGDCQKKGLAALCLVLAGRHADALLLMNQFLSPPDKPDQDRKFWLGQVESFHSHYLTKRTHVVDVLDRQGKMSVVKSSHAMLELNAFFQHIQERRSRKAWSIAERLQLLPTSNADVQARASDYQSLDAVVKQAYPALLVGVMDIMHEEHVQIKQQLLDGSSAASVARERLRELEEKSRSLVAFAGHIGVTQGQLEHLSRVDALMI